jgi:hypothetical protein
LRALLSTSLEDERLRLGHTIGPRWGQAADRDCRSRVERRHPASSGSSSSRNVYQLAVIASGV